MFGTIFTNLWPIWNLEVSGLELAPVADPCHKIIKLRIWKFIICMKFWKLTNIWRLWSSFNQLAALPHLVNHPSQLQNLSESVNLSTLDLNFYLLYSHTKALICIIFTIIVNLKMPSFVTSPHLLGMWRLNIPVSDLPQSRCCSRPWTQELFSRGSRCPTSRSSDRPRCPCAIHSMSFEGMYKKLFKYQ